MRIAMPAACSMSKISQMKGTSKGSPPPNAANATPKTTQLDKVTLRLKGATGAEFGGYYAAKRLGYYRSFGLDVRITVGAPTVTPEEAVASGHANIGAGWLLGLLAMRDTGTNLVDIAQMFVRSGMTEVVKKSSGISSIADLRGKRVGVWCCGNQLELYASLTKHGMDPEHHKGVTIVNQPFDVTAFLHGTTLGFTVRWPVFQPFSDC